MTNARIHLKPSAIDGDIFVRHRVIRSVMNNILFKRRGVRLAPVYLRIVITNSVNSEPTMECVILVRTLVRGTKKKRRNPVIDKWNLSIAPSMDDFSEQSFQIPSSCVLFSKRFEVHESTIGQSPET